MKFKLATIYKVPFDNSYSNVVDYHRFVYSLGNYELQDGEEHTLRIRSLYFNTRPHRAIYNSDTVFKSVKIVNDTITVSIAGDFGEISDYNYIVFSAKDNETSYLSTQLFCFITSIVSNNDSDNPSVTITAEIDHWTNNIVSMRFNTPDQLEHYAHLSNLDVFHNLVDDRLPIEFNTENEYSYLFDDCIIWIRIEADKSHITPNMSINGMLLDSTSTSTVVVYVPYTFIRKVGDSYVGRVIHGICTEDASTVVNFDIMLLQNSMFSWLNSQYTRNVSLTIFTPMGVFKQSEYIGDVLGLSYLKVNQIENNKDFVVIKDGKHYLGMYSTSNTLPTLYGTDEPNLFPYNNTVESVSIVDDRFSQRSRNPFDPYYWDTERKMFQYPYTKYILCYKGNKYDITPEYAGSYLTLSFMRLRNVCCRINGDGQFNHTLMIPLSDNDGIPYSENAWETYKQNALEADTMKAVVGSIAGVTAGIALAPATGGASLIGSLAAGTASFAGLQANMMKQRNIPDKETPASNSSFDVYPSVIPRLEKTSLTYTDKNICMTLWRKFGYPVNTIEKFETRRFWYDYKKLKNATFTNITNPIARRKLEDAFNNGVTIWHQNAGFTDPITSVEINNYYYNNVSLDEMEISQ